MIVTRSSLIRRVRDKEDHQCWEEFFRLYQPLVCGYVRKKVHHPDVEDIVADVFARLVKVLPSFSLDHSKGRFRTWLWQVTMSAIADWARKKPRELLVEVLPEKNSPEDEDPEWTNEYRRAILVRIFPCVQSQMQVKTWTCFVEFVVKNRKAKEIAPEVGLSANAVCVNANRVLAKVRQLCLEEYEEDLDN